jgi:UDP-N-acetylglucosamine 2-epimerase (non-hydrolysing)
LGLNAQRIRLLEPQPYLSFLAMQRGATVVITDSGGIQEETTYLGVPCLTLRENTERPITVSLGTNVLVGRDADRLRNELAKILAGHAKKGSIPPFWDGRAAERIASIITGKACPGPDPAHLEGQLTRV